MEDGLVDNRILTMFQDSKGYLWIGTYTGISKWDGNIFTNITKSDGLPPPAVLDIIETKDRTILFSTYGKGLLIYIDGIVDTINTNYGLSSNMVTHFWLFDDKLIVISNAAQEYSQGFFLSFQNNLVN